MSDIANLKQSNIVNDRLVYSRQKTGKRISIPLSDNAKQIIHKYMDKCSGDYVFPILNDIRAIITTRNIQLCQNIKYNFSYYWNMLNSDFSKFSNKKTK